jgi:hypothetical protein
MAPLFESFICLKCGVQSPLKVFCGDCLEREDVTRVRRAENQDAYAVHRKDGSIEMIPREVVYAAKPKFTVPTLEVRDAEKWPVKRCGAHGTPEVPEGPCTCQW